MYLVPKPLARVHGHTQGVVEIVAIATSVGDIPICSPRPLLPLGADVGAGEGAANLGDKFDGYSEIYGLVLLAKATALELPSTDLANIKAAAAGLDLVPHPDDAEKEYACTYGEPEELTATDVDDKNDVPVAIVPVAVAGLAYFVPKPLDVQG